MSTPTDTFSQKFRKERPDERGGAMKIEIKSRFGGDCTGDLE